MDFFNTKSFIITIRSLVLVLFGQLASDKNTSLDGCKQGTRTLGHRFNYLKDYQVL